MIKNIVIWMFALVMLSTFSHATFVLYDDAADDEIYTYFINQSQNNLWTFDTDHYESSVAGNSLGNTISRKNTSEIIRGPKWNGKVFYSTTEQEASAWIGEMDFTIDSTAADAISPTWVTGGYGAVWIREGGNTVLYEVTAGSGTQIHDCGAELNVDGAIRDIRLYHTDTELILNVSGTVCKVGDTNHTPNDDWSYSFHGYDGGTRRSGWEVKDIYDVKDSGGATTNTVTSNTPSNNTVNTSVLVANFTYSNDGAEVGTCGLFIDGVENATASAIPSGSSPTISSVGMEVAGNYSWLVRCNSSTGPNADSETRNYVYDIDEIIVTSNSPANNTFNRTQFTANFTYENELGENGTCNLVINGSTNASVSDVVNGTSPELSSSGISVTGTYEWYVACNSTNIGATNSEKRIFEYEAPAINITVNSPANNTVNNTQLVANFTYVNNIGETGTCGLIINSSENSSSSGIVNGTTSTLTSVLSDSANYTWYVQCNSSSIATTVSSNRQYTYDISSPTIDDNFINNSVYYLSNITGQFNFTDDILLHTFNVSVDGVTVFNITHIHAFTYQYNLSIDPQNYGVGLHTLQVRIADGHTKEELLDPDAYNPTNGLFNDKIEYNIRSPYKELDILMERKGGSILDKWEFVAQKDRYSEIYTPFTKSSTQTFVIESSEDIQVIEDPYGRYGGKWLIIGNHWRDFVLRDELNTTLSFNRISSKEMEVTISGIQNTARLEFDSIGELNINTKNYQFYVSNVSTTYDAEPLELSEQEIIFEMNKTAGVTISASFTWNGTVTNYTTTRFSLFDRLTAVVTMPDVPSGGTTNISATWNYTLKGLFNNETGSVNLNQTITKISIDDCTLSSDVTINFTFIDEETGTLVATDIEILFTFWNRSRAYSVNTSFLKTNSTFHQFCIYPTDAQLMGDIILEYNAPGYDNRSYLEVNHAFDNVTDQILLRISNSSSTNQIELNVDDENDDPIEDIIIEISKYSLSGNNFTLVEVVSTNFNGQAIANLIPEKTYRFDLYRGGELQLSRQIEVLESTTELFFKIISTSQTPFLNFLNIIELDTTLTYDNTTSVVSLSWSDPDSLSTEMCLRVIRMNSSTGSELFGLNCTTDSTITTLTLSLTGQFNSSFVAEARAKSPQDNMFYTINSLSINLATNLGDFGEEGLLYVWLLVGTFAFLMLGSNPVLVIFFALSALFASWAIGFLSVSIYALTGIVVAGIVIALILRS